MTQFVCSVLLHASTLRLCWRTIKATKTDQNTCNSQDDGQPPLQTSSSLDEEIPQLWTLLACHTIYAGVLECLVSWLPFYYYAKMLLFLVTFIPGTRFPNYWFECWLVPGIDRLHSALDVDWRTYLTHQLRYLPLLLLDLLFVPGILGDGSDDGTEAAAGRDHLVAEEETVDASELQSPSKSRSRLVASGLQLRNFSKEHAPWTPSAAKLSSSLSSPMSRKKIVLESPTATPTMRSLFAQTPATTKVDRSRRRRRRTMNEKFRKVLCGDENIRIRDYLFDLDMPSLPAMQGGEEGGRLSGEGRRKVVVSSADRDGDERRRKQNEQNRRRRRTFGGTLMRREEFLSSSISGDSRKEGGNSDGDKSLGGGDNTGSESASTTVRRSRRIAKKQK